VFVAYPDYIRQKAVRLRQEQRLTIDEIAERLAVSRTTAYGWVGEIPIPRKPGRGFASPAQKKGTKAMQEKYRRIREWSYEQGCAEFKSLAVDRTFRDFICMYLGEGYKRSRNDVSVANSDPAVVLLAKRWISRLGRNKIRYSVQYHADQDLDEIRRFWAGVLEVQPDDINLQRKSNSNQLTGRSWRSEHGVLTVSMGDTQLRARLQAWMDRLRAEWG